MFHYILYAAAMIVLAFISYSNSTEDMAVFSLGLEEYTFAGAFLAILGLLLRLSVKTNKAFGPIYKSMRILTVLLSSLLLLAAAFVLGLGIFIEIARQIEAGAMEAPRVLFLPEEWYWLFAGLFGIAGFVIHYWASKDGAFIVWRFRNEMEKIPQ